MTKPDPCKWIIVIMQSTAAMLLGTRFLPHIDESVLVAIQKLLDESVRILSKCFPGLFTGNC